MDDSIAEDEEVLEEGNSTLDMSDEDFLKMEVPEDEPITKEIEEETEEEEEVTVEEESEPEESTTEDTQQEEAEPDTTDTTDEKSESKEEDTDSKEETSIDYEAEYKKLLSPFKANNKDMQVDNVDDALTLMKMGANYNKKMAGLKPNLKLMKMLENHDLLSEEKLSYLIDLEKKNPEAISKLLKDSKLDPLDIDTDKDTDYRPSTYTVDDKEVELDAVLDNIRDTPAFEDTIDIISNKWDESSKQVLFDSPDIIEVINSHVGNGIYEKIATVVENERMLGKLKGLSDLEAYKQVGDAINKQGGFNEQPVKKEAEPIKKAVDPKLKAKKLAAGTTKSTTATKNKEDFNPLAMSDEEFEKISSSKFI